MMAARLGMTAGELRRRMSTRELTDWAGFVRYEESEREAAANRAKIQQRGRRR